MLLSARFLNDVSNVNSFSYATSLEFNKGTTQTVYFQLIDRSLLLAINGFNPEGRRYVPPAGSTLSVYLVNVEDGKKILRPASQAFVGLDGSIWSLPIFGTDPLDGTVTIGLTLTQPGGVVLTSTINAGMRIC